MHDTVFQVLFAWTIAFAFYADPAAQRAVASVAMILPSLFSLIPFWTLVLVLVTPSVVAALVCAVPVICLATTVGFACLLLDRTGISADPWTIFWVTSLKKIRNLSGPAQRLISGLYGFMEWMTAALLSVAIVTVMTLGLSALRDPSIDSFAGRADLQLFIIQFLPAVLYWPSTGLVGAVTRTHVRLISASVFASFSAWIQKSDLLIGIASKLLAWLMPPESPQKLTSNEYSEL